MADFSWANIKSNFRSRSKTRVSKNLGLISLGDKEANIYRDKKLHLYDTYYENTQYDSLPPWDQTADAYGQHISVRKRKPRLRHPFAKSLSQRLAAKLVGASVFPSFIVTDSPDDTEFIKAVIRESNLKAHIIEPVRRMLSGGSCFMRFYLSGGSLKTEWYAAKFCYPEFQDNGELESIEIKYVYDDFEDLDSNEKPKKKWYKLELNTVSEILYDNPEFHENKEPEFQVVDSVEHGMGFVQGEWLRTIDDNGVKKNPDGYGLTCDLMDFIDELNYSLSQSSQAVGYNQDPQLTIKNMDEEEMANLIRSATKSWNLGRNGEAGFLESNLAGVERAMDLRDKVRLNIQDISRIVLLDPEKIVGSAQSAKAMEVLHGPLKDLIDELRIPMEKILKNITLKMSLMILVASKQGIDVPLMLPPGYKPASLDLVVEWPPIFQQTMEDLQKKVQVASSATSASIISRETALKWLAKDFNIENVEEEIAKVAAQPVINPFGGF